MSTVAYDEAIRRHIDLIQFFRDGHCTSTAVIAEKYGISQRTAQRYLERIDLYHLPLERKGANWRKACAK